jgi:hypothetical protein
MSDYETSKTLTMEDRLKAIAYQFISLYERWSEDRQVAAKQGADIQELVEVFIEQVKQFKTLEPNVRLELLTSIQNATSSAFEKIGETIGQEATRATDHIAKQLAQVTDRTERTLTRYESETIATQWKIIGVSVVTTVLTSLLLVWLLIPKPTSPLTDEQLLTYQNGITMEKFWDKISKKEQNRLINLAYGFEQESNFAADSSDNNNN